MTDRSVDFTKSESEDSSNEENVEPAENSHASSGLEGTFQVIARRSENEQAEHDLVQDVSQERGRKVGSKNDEYDIAEEFENLPDFKQWFADKQDKWTRYKERIMQAYFAGEIRKAGVSMAGRICSAATQYKIHWSTEKEATRHPISRKLKD
ncbi:hypothetical protein DdX_17233 [Ditylenchus destructor]|uniref:Uncharacterized protein n=1 Tax=Ditylenchus destructor TaxID=166010 RepID=A0AAD4MS87_9BILA|nr:hypothetical protein DdX_17233 [Ditylenchus destructor]